MKALLFLLVSIFIFASCSPQKRLQRLTEKHPELIYNDTIDIVDTLHITTERVVTDTVTSLNSIIHDTLIITKENLKIKTFYNYETDSIYIFGECDTIVKTEIIERQIPVEKLNIVKQSRSPFLLGMICVLALMLFITLGILLYKRR